MSDFSVEYGGYEGVKCYRCNKLSVAGCSIKFFNNKFLVAVGGCKDHINEKDMRDTFESSLTMNIQNDVLGMGKGYKLVVKEGCREVIDSDPNLYKWVDGEPYPTSNETAKNFTAVPI